MDWSIPGWQLPLAQLCDSALPTGAFSHSFGLETYVGEGVVHDEPSFAAWLTALIRNQLTTSDGLAIRLAAEALSAGDLDALWTLDALLAAQALPRQIREANRTVGGRMLTIALSSVPTPELGRYADQVAAGRCHGHPALALALAVLPLGAPPGWVCAAHLFGVATTLTTNAVRAIPLGQTSGQRVLTGVRTEIDRALERIAGLGWHDVGTGQVGLEIAQMRHERQRTRMFMS